MKIKGKSALYFILALIMLSFVAFFAWKGKLGYVLLTSFFCSLLLIGVIKQSLQSINNITFLFLLFHFLYTYAPVLTVFFGVDTRNLFEASTTSSACSFLFLSTLGLFGLSIPYLKTLPSSIMKRNEAYFNKRKFTNYALLFLVIAVIGETINMFRAGGIDLISQGKAIYQSKVGALFITIPTVLFLQTALFFTGLRLFLSYENRIFKSLKSKVLVTVLFLLTPLLFIYASIGFRSPLLAAAFSLIIGFTYFTVIKKANRRVLLLLFVGYSALAILFGIRGQLKLLFSSGNWERFNKYVFEEKAYLKYYNPANNEFGASYMNYIKFYKAKDENEFLLGSSYFEGFITAIPGALFPFDKPKPIAYKFRDTYFKEYKKRGRIAGTGFSSLMEAQWNFGIVGPLIIYFLYGVFFWLLEYFRNKNKHLFLFPLFYSLLLPLSQSIHRSASGFYVSYILQTVFFILALFFIKTILIGLSKTKTPK